MKANLFLTFISVMLAALLGYLAFNVANGEDMWHWELHLLCCNSYSDYGATV